MANIAISGLPEQTGKTDNDVLAIVDSGNTTTSKIKVSTLLSGVGGGGYTIANGTNNLVPNYYSASDLSTGTGNVIINGDTVSKNTITNVNNLNVQNFVSGTNNSIENKNSAIIGGSGNSITPFSSSVLSGGCVIAGGENNTVSHFKNFIGGGESCSAGGGGYKNHGIIAGENCSTGNKNNQFIGGGRNNTMGSAQYGAIIGGLGNACNHTGSIVLGGSSQSTSINNEVVVPYLTISNYSVLDFIDDSAAATGGVPLGGVYRTGNDLKIRIV